MPPSRANRRMAAAAVRYVEPMRRRSPPIALQSPLIALPILLLLWVPSSPLATRPASTTGQPPQDRPLFSTETNLVVLNVTVLDRKGRHVTGLSKDSFRVFENSQPQMIRLFLGEDAPVTAGLVIDNSGSMYGNQELVAAAASAFAENSKPLDEIYALTFNDEVKAVLPPSTPFTNDVRTLREAFSRAIVARGRTALYDGIAEGLRYATSGSHARKVLVILSDGGDNASRTNFEAVLRSTLISNVVIYTVGLIDELERDADPKRLRQLAEATGGQAFRPRDVRQVVPLFPQIAFEMRHAYTLGYVPAASDSKPAFRPIHVEVTSGSGEALRARTRSGYFAQP
jgi:Ca-activated chloride channel homolog